jgi:hypothetical protein
VLRAVADFASDCTRGGGEYSSEAASSHRKTARCSPVSGIEARQHENEATSLKLCISREVNARLALLGLRKSFRDIEEGQSEQLDRIF